MDRSVAHIANRLLGDAHFLYIAFAPIACNSRASDRVETESAASVLVKVGISTIPMRRLVDVHCASPFRIAFAAFVPTYGGKRKAEKVESRILQKFKQYRTRGEWLMLPNSPEQRAEFAATAKAIIQDETGRPVEWTRVTGDELAKFMVTDKVKSAA